MGRQCAPRLACVYTRIHRLCFHSFSFRRLQIVMVTNMLNANLESWANCSLLRRLEGIGALDNLVSKMRAWDHQTNYSRHLKPQTEFLAFMKPGIGCEGWHCTTFHLSCPVPLHTASTDSFIIYKYDILPPGSKDSGHLPFPKWKLRSSAGCVRWAYLSSLPRHTSAVTPV